MEIAGEPISDQIQDDPNAGTMAASFMGKSTLLFNPFLMRRVIDNLIAKVRSF